MTSVIPIKPPYTPEFLSVAQLAIEGFLADGGDVFEYGSGHSTLWFSQFANVASVEHDEEWSKEVIRALIETGRDWPDKVAYRFVEKENMPGIIHRYRYDAFDLVLVDCLDAQRSPAVKAAMPHVKPGGWLVMDDSNWPLWDPAKDLLKTWPYTEMRGPHIRKNGDLRSHETRIYRRPA